jgi:tRNA A37 N6-isopentenylltransferase MiaA
MLSTALKVKLSQKVIYIAHIYRRFDIATIKISLHELNLKPYFSINLCPCHICVIHF